MTLEQYQRVTEIFNQVIESPSDQQAGLLSALCAGDDTLRQEVESPPASTPFGAKLYRSRSRLPGWRT